MTICFIRRYLYLLAVLLAIADIRPSTAVETGNRSNAHPNSGPAEIQREKYQRKLIIFLSEHKKFEDKAKVYWDLVSQKRRVRNDKRANQQPITLDDYVLTQPPIYTGPEKPIDPFIAIPSPPIPTKPIPVVADFLKAAKEQFQFVPKRPKDELEYKRIYAKVAARAGLTRDHVVRIYGFESGGNGTYDVQAGLEYDTPGAHAISTALGYNQLLATNSVELLAENGDEFVETLVKRLSTLSGKEKRLLEEKIKIVQRMIEFVRSVPDRWSEHEKLANTLKGHGVHALILDIDVGPLLQTQKLLTSISFARKSGFHRDLTAAELEMLNLTGDGTGFDMVTMPINIRKIVPTSNFFQRTGYERNPVASENNVVAKLLEATNSKMDDEMKLQGAQDLAAAFLATD